MRMCTTSNFGTYLRSTDNQVLKPKIVMPCKTTKKRLYVVDIFNFGYNINSTPTSGVVHDLRHSSTSTGTKNFAVSYANTGL